MAALSVAPTASAAPLATTYSGSLDPGEADTHYFSNSPPGTLCIQVIQPYTIAVEVSGTAEVTIAGQTYVVAGAFTMTILRNWCTSFEITVRSTTPAVPIVYAVEVMEGSAVQPPPVPPVPDPIDLVRSVLAEVPDIPDVPGIPEPPEYPGLPVVPGPPAVPSLPVDIQWG